jgi:hypothetical protein
MLTERVQIPDSVSIYEDLFQMHGSCIDIHVIIIKFKLYIPHDKKCKYLLLTVMQQNSISFIS